MKRLTEKYDVITSVDKDGNEIHSKGIRPIYDRMREYDISIDEILNIFNEHDWNVGEIEKAIHERIKSLRERYEKKQAIKEATDDFEV